jgi:hypothetical protein
MYVTILHPLTLIAFDLMSKDHMATLVPFWVLGIILIGSVNVHNNNTLAYAHSFSPNSLSTFVSRAIEADV